MPDENLGFGERPKVFRTSYTLPFDLKGFIDTRSKLFARYGEKNASAYIASLVEADRAAFVKRNGKVARK